MEEYSCAIICLQVADDRANLLQPPQDAWAPHKDDGTSLAATRGYA